MRKPVWRPHPWRKSRATEQSVVGCDWSTCRRPRAGTKPSNPSSEPACEGFWVFKVTCKSAGMILNAKGLKHERRSIRRKMQVLEIIPMFNRRIEQWVRELLWGYHSRLQRSPERVETLGIRYYLYPTLHGRLGCTGWLSYSHRVIMLMEEGWVWNNSWWGTWFS